MDLPIPPSHPNGRAFGRNAANTFFNGPAPDRGDDLTTNVPLKSNINHTPILSNRGAGVQWNRRTVQTTKPPEKTVLLFKGNFVIDSPVPNKLLRRVPHSISVRDEFNHMRYSAVTCDPVDFCEERFTLRPALFARPRTTEIMIIVTMYNEDDILFARTLSGILANIKYLTLRDKSPWDKSAWKKVVVCIISDGRVKINPRTRALLTLLGVYQEGRAKERVEGKNVMAHLYEYTTQMNVEVKNNTVRVVPTGAVPCQLLFCLKERNQKKLNSHRWALQAFGRVLNPNVCIFIDAGTEPGPASIFHLWEAFDKYPFCGSVSGVTKVLLNRRYNVVTNPLLAAQNFEYKLWNVLDRPFDSLFGLRFDMPGAMFAYRFVALLNDKFGEGPMSQYFSPERYSGAEGVFSANMALTEERALSFALLTKRDCCWDLRYEYAASATVDVPETAAEYISQQRRWFNGNLFGSIYAIAHINYIFRSSHSDSRKILLFIQCLYQAAALLLSWFSIGNLFLIFHIITANFIHISLSKEVGIGIIQFLDFWYVATLFLSFVFALGHHPKDTKYLSILVASWSTIMMILMAVFVGLGITTIQVNLTTIGDPSTIAGFHHTVSTTLVPLFITYVFWLILALISSSPAYIFNSVIQYILLLPMRINISNLYAFCNIHDVSWGVRLDSAPMKLESVTVNIPMDDDAEQVQDDYDEAAQLLKTKNEGQSNSYWAGGSFDMDFRRSRTLVMASWALTNGTLVFIVLNSNIGSPDHQAPQGLQRSMKFVGLVLWSFAVLTGIKFAGAMYYFIGQRTQHPRRTINSQKRKVT